MRSKRLAHSLLNEKNRFSIRKLSIGAASVLIGCTFYLGSSNTVQAADGDATSGDSKINEVMPASEETPSSEKKETDSQEKPATDSSDVVPGTGDAKNAKGKDEEAQTGNDPASDEGSQGQEKTDQSQTPDEEPNDQENNVSKILDQNKDLKAIFDQIKNNAGYQKDSEQFLDPDAVKGAKILPQVAIQGEVPNLDAKAFVNQDMIDTLNNLGVDLLADDPAAVKLSWAQAPDVSKLGQTTGKLKVEYAISYDDDNNPTYSSFVIGVPVDVVAGEKKTEGQVRNTLNVIDADTNKVIYHYTWIGNKGGEYPGDDNVNPALGNNTDLIERNNSILGYKQADQEVMGDPKYDMDYFLDHDITRVMEVVPVVPDRKVIIEDAAKKDNGLEGADHLFQADPYEYFSDPENQDPATFVYGLGYLDPTDNVDWGVKPIYEDGNCDKDGNYIDGKLANHPTIVIKNAQGEVIQTLSGKDLEEALLYNYDAFMGGSMKGYPTVKGKVIVYQGDNLPDAASVITNLPSSDPNSMKPDAVGLQEKLNKYFNVSWKLIPDTNKLGYQVAYLQFAPKDGVNKEAEASATGMYEDQTDFSAGPYEVLIQVVPRPEQPNNPVNPSNPTQPTDVPPTTPQPSQPTKPVQPSKPTEPTEPAQPTKPHHKKNDDKKPEKPTPKPENHKSENDNYAPKGENNSWSDNFRPHAQSLNGETTVNNLPQGYSVKPNGQVVDPAGNVVGYVDQNGIVHFTSELPQTGEKNSNLTKLGLISLGVASIAMLIGLLGDRKRN